MVEQNQSGCSISLARFHRADHSASWSYTERDYHPDLYIAARRILDEFHWKVFKLYFVRAWKWKRCCAKLRCTRGHFFHSVYRVEQFVGRALAEVEPYALYPPDEYFCGTVRKGKAVVYDADEPGTCALRPPLAA